MRISHILFALTEMEIITFLSLGGACILDPSNDTEPNEELLKFLAERGLKPTSTNPEGEQQCQSV